MHTPSERFPRKNRRRTHRTKGCVFYALFLKVRHTSLFYAVKYRILLDIEQGERPRATNNRTDIMKDQILKVTFPDDIDACDTEINFTTAKDWEDVNAAASIIAGIGEFPTAEITFDMQEDDGREYRYTEHGEDAVSMVLEYFNDYFKQEVLRRAAMACRTTAGENWIKATIDWDPEWTEEC